MKTIYMFIYVSLLQLFFIAFSHAAAISHEYGTRQFNNNFSQIDSPEQLKAIQQGQVCPQSSYRLSTQTQVNLFPKICTLIRGNLTIGTENGKSSDIYDISKLSNIVSVLGHVNIVNNDFLTNLNGLNNLTIIGANLSIRFNERLFNINALSQLKFIQGSLIVSNNKLLSNLDSINVKHLGIDDYQGDVIISNNSELSDCSSVCPLLAKISNSVKIDIFGNKGKCSGKRTLKKECGFGVLCPPKDYFYQTQSEVDNFFSDNKCTRIQGTLHIGATNDLSIPNDISNLFGVSMITSVSNNLDIKNLYLLNNLKSLSNVSEVGGDLSITYDQMITDLKGLSNLDTVNGAVEIGYNLNLVNIKDLSNIKVVDRLIFVFNYSLSGLKGLKVKKILWPLNSDSPSLVILNNPQLKNCSELCPLINQRNIRDSALIERNKSSCTDLSTVRALCPSFK